MQTKISEDSQIKESELVAEFWVADLEALFTQVAIALALNYSEAWCERQRWAGTGPPFLKIGRRVLYRKRDVLEWLAAHQTYHSTSEYSEAHGA